MKKTLFQAMIVFTAVSAAASAFGSSLKDLEKEPLPKISPPKVVERVLKNGMRCFLLEDHTLPSVHIDVTTRTGSIYEPADKLGLAGISGMLMRTGGAGDRLPADFDKAADSLGALISSSIGTESGEASLSILSEDLGEGVSLLRDMLFAPRFDESRFTAARLKIEEGLRREDDDPKALLARKFRQLVYGKTSPWARRPDNKTLENISIADVKAFHRNYFRTSNMIVSAAGDFDTEKLVSLLSKFRDFGDGGKAVFPDVPKVELKFDPATEQIFRPMTQTFIKVGHLGIKRHNPDKYALYLMTDILGGSNFKSRLMEDIRTKRGMAYSVWSDLSPGTDYGLFQVYVNTKSSQAAKVVELVKEHLKRMAEGEGLTSDELEFARQSALAQLVFEFDNAYKAASKRASFYYFGYPGNYWEIYRDKISAVTQKDIKTVSRRYLHPDGLKIEIVGPKMKD